MKLTQKRMARPNLAGLLATRRGALTLALVSALAAAGVLVFAMGQYKSSLNTATKQDTVLVAAGLIKKGTSGNTIAAEGLFKLTPISATRVSPGALSDSAFLKGSVARSDILPGQQLTVAEFTTVIGLVGQLAPNQRAVSVAIDEAHGDTDVLHAGDQVDVYGDFTPPGGHPLLTLLVPNALVIKPAGGGASAPSAGAAGASLVLAVSTAEAPKLAYTAENGRVWIFLRGTSAAPPIPGTTTLNSILSSSTSTTTGTIP